MLAMLADIDAGVEKIRQLIRRCPEISLDPAVESAIWGAFASVNFAKERAHHAGSGLHEFHRDDDATPTMVFRKVKSIDTEYALHRGEK